MDTAQQIARRRPNILLITCDQYRFPRFSYGENAGFAQPLKEILGFQGSVDETNPYAKYFPGLLRLRKNAVLLRNHTIAASACTPSRATIYTGQYGTRTGVTQTDGVFKNGDSGNFPWLADDGIPTLGTWMRRAGYTTHYFGKWHVSNPPSHSLQKYGFDDWELSYPEPHGTANNNLGLYRDIGFTDAAATFIRRMGLAENYNRLVATQQRYDPDGPAPSTDRKPWFTVLSLTNPHDIATYPGVISQALPSDSPPTTITLPNGKEITLPNKTQSPFGPLTVPAATDLSLPPAAGTMQIALNPLDFPQDCANASPTQGEDLSTKPACQAEYAYKMGFALATKLGYSVAAGVAAALPPGVELPPALLDELAANLALRSNIPFHLAPDPAAACLDFIQFYAYLHSVVDPHINRVLDALESSGQADDTIVVFLADHGEYAAAHGMMMEKWHTAYEEALHVPLLVQLNPRAAHLPGEASHSAGTVINIDALTSHIDILPTILGLALVPDEEREHIHETLAGERAYVPALPGVNLAPLIRGHQGTIVEPDGRERRGVLFITDDEITAPLPVIEDPHTKKSMQEFAVYCTAVNKVITGNNPLNKGPVPWLGEGSVCQPNHIRCVRTMQYKLARYCLPGDSSISDQWEMYDLKNDPNEETNLVQVRANPPTAVTNPPSWAPASLQQVIDELAQLLAELEARDLPMTYPRKD